jgi:hypothetical protein
MRRWNFGVITDHGGQDFITLNALPLITQRMEVIFRKA